MMKILLACGSGCSSGFIAASMRKAAKKQGVAVEVKAVGDAEILIYAEDYDILMFGPHIQYRLEEFRRLLANKEITLCVIDQKKYGALDGAGILQDAYRELGTEQEK